MKLFAVYLGGTAPRANTELHDLVFAVGESIQDTYEQLLEMWFGSPDGLHIDSWIELRIVDGFKISLSEKPSTDPRKLYFVNMGAYAPGQLTEIHANEFLVSEDKKEIVHRAKNLTLKGSQFVHRDYLYEVDECLEVVQVGRYYVHLEPTSEVQAFSPENAYHLIPREIVKAFKERRRA